MHCIKINAFKKFILFEMRLLIRAEKVTLSNLPIELEKSEHQLFLPKVLQVEFPNSNTRN